MPKGKKLLGGLLIGTAIGALAGLLFAPKAGKETRKAIRDRASALKQKAGGRSGDPLKGNERGSREHGEPADGSTTHPSS